MPVQRSNSYNELGQVYSTFSPDLPVTTHMVINGPEQRLAAGVNTPRAEILDEIEKLTQLADLLHVPVSALYDEDSNSALVVIEGTAGNAANLIAFMADAESVRAR